jgi:hypothetical protein
MDTPSQRRDFRKVLDGGYADCLGALGALGDLELNTLVLVEGPVALALDLGVVDENVLRSAIRRDEAETLFGVEPFHSSLCHTFYFFLLTE